MLTRRQFLMAAAAAPPPLPLESAGPLLERFDAEAELTRLILVLSPT
jgi:hypothetical protein